MDEISLKKLEQGQTKIRKVPIAVTLDGFWCCPSPAGFQKTLKPENLLNRSKPSSPFHNNTTHKRHASNMTSRSRVISNDQVTSELVMEGSVQRPLAGNVPRKLAAEFGEPSTSDVNVVLLGRQGLCVKLSVHKDVLMEKSRFFSDKLCEQDRSDLSCLEVEECEDVEIFVEAVGLMYCKEMRQRLIKNSVSRVLRILKVSELLGFNSCIQSCLEYLEAVPWVGEEEEEKVVSSILHLQTENFKLTPVLNRLSSDCSKLENDATLPYIIDLVLKSNDDKARREMKSVVLTLLRENNNENTSDICNRTIYGSCKTCLSSLLYVFKQASESDFSAKPKDFKDVVAMRIGQEADNLSWLLEILTNGQMADEFALMWAKQQELAALHGKILVVTRYRASYIFAQILVGIGRGEIVLPLRETRRLLLETWLEPLIADFSWLQRGCRSSFDRTVVEEGIGQTILTLALEDQRIILLSWLERFLKTGDNNCPNLKKAFEIWWRRTFIRPYFETQPNSVGSDSSMTRSE